MDVIRIPIESPSGSVTPSTCTGTNAWFGGQMLVTDGRDAVHTGTWLEMTVHVKDAEVFAPRASCTVMTTAETPFASGVPVSAPVCASIDSPAGSPSAEYLSGV